MCWTSPSYARSFYGCSTRGGDCADLLHVSYDLFNADALCRWRWTPPPARLEAMPRSDDVYPGTLQKTESRHGSNRPIVANQPLTVIRITAKAKAVFGVKQPLLSLVFHRHLGGPIADARLKFRHFEQQHRLPRYRLAGCSLHLPPRDWTLFLSRHTRHFVNEPSHSRLAIEARLSRAPPIAT